MNKDIKISIIVPIFNLQNELTRCVSSILNQTYGNLEIILVNDGSDDNSWEIICDLTKKDERIIPINKENGGVTSARLAGIQIASGDYIGFVDGDDEIEPDMYELLLRNAIEYHADISHCGYKMIFTDNRINYFHNTNTIVIQDNIKGIQDLLEGTIVEPGLCNKLYKRELFDDLLIDLSIKINEDLLMNYYLFKKANKSIFDDQCKYNYVVRYSSASRQKLNKNKIYDPIKVKEIILNDCNSEIQSDANKAYISTCIYSYCGLVMEGNAFKYDKKEVRKMICNHKEYIQLLPKKTKLLGNLIIFLPFIFDIIYPIYSNIFQKKKYE